MMRAAKSRRDGVDDIVISIPVAEHQIDESTTDVRASERRAILDTCRAATICGNQHVHVVGTVRQGKTTLARRIVEFLSMEPGAYTVRELSVAACGDDNALLQQLVGDSRRKVKNLSEVDVARLGLSHNTTNVFVIDDFDQLLLACPSALRIIEHLMGRNESIVVVVTFSGEPWHTIQARDDVVLTPAQLRLTPFTQEDTEQIVQQRMSGYKSKSTVLSKTRRDQIVSLTVKFNYAKERDPDVLVEAAQRMIDAVENRLRNEGEDADTGDEDVVKVSQKDVLIAMKSLQAERSILITPYMGTAKPCLIALGDKNNVRAHRSICPTNEWNSVPIIDRLLIVVTYLCSYTPPKNDRRLFLRKSGGSRQPRSGLNTDNAQHKRGPTAASVERITYVTHALASTLEAGVVRGDHEPEDMLPFKIHTSKLLQALTRLEDNGCVMQTAARQNLAMYKYASMMERDVVSEVALTLGIDLRDYLMIE